jgi:glutaredoxin
MYLIIGKTDCYYCDSAKGLLDKKGITYIYKNIDRVNVLERDMWLDIVKKKFNRTTVPVVMKLTGGYTDLEEELNG